MPHLAINGNAIHYQWAAPFLPERETAVFLHDGLGAIGSWKDLPARVADQHQFNALVYDRWGYGLSDPRPAFPYQFMEAEVPALLTLLDQLGLARVHLIGHSDGGSIALVFSALHPERVHTLTTIAAHTFVEKETRAGIQALVDLQQAGKTPDWLFKLHGDRGDEVLSQWCSGWLTDEHAGWNIEKYLGYVESPTLVIQGESDEFGTWAQVQSILNRVHNSKSWMVEGCGHTPHNQQPDAFLETFSTFLGSRGSA